MSLTLLASGSNAQGQLANGTTEDSHFFAPCIFSDSNLKLKKILQIASGANHTLLLAEIEDPDAGVQTRLYGCGDGSLGQLGVPRHEDKETNIGSLVFRPVYLPLEEEGLEDYRPKAICTSWQTTYIVLACQGKPDQLISMGSNDFGDLGVGKSPSRSLPFHIVRFDHLDVDGVSLDPNHLVIEAIAAGQHHIIAQLHTRLSNTMACDVLVGWGTCRHGELGPQDTAASTSSINNFKGKGKTDKGPTFFSTPRIIPSTFDRLSEDKIVSIALGNQHSVFLRQSGKVHGLGSNRRRQLAGLEDVKKVVEDIGCTWNGTYLVVHDTEAGTEHIRRIYATGSHQKGQLGRRALLLPSASSSSGLEDLQLDQVDFAIDVTSRSLTTIACGSEHVLALFTSQTTGVFSEVWGWGWNEHGNLGTGSTEDVGLPVRIWPTEEEDSNPAMQGRVVGIWAGCGTSWIAVNKS
ncbi:alpha tubulin suppressor [Paramarasmius palmivorus]|uniref:Alpha tubulin suppressor n=1 Tax=Paramarasmius palmivorus TaxID=297713 RepID=A0AAW0DIA6_9AGAR